ncbi:MAG: glutaredoxin family protein [Merismopedia sp. SIO2A8]|nr:glutaredoxin family protein [Merismopedia sp. SIO2A8]
METSHQLVMYSKPGCHLCEGLQEKLEAIQNSDRYGLTFELKIRDITTHPEWFNAYQYEIPVLYWMGRSQGTDDTTMQPIPRPSPRSSVDAVYRLLEKSLST